MYVMYVCIFFINVCNFVNVCNVCNACNVMYVMDAWYVMHVIHVMKTCLSMVMYVQRDALMSCNAFYVGHAM